MVAGGVAAVVGGAATGGWVGSGSVAAGWGVCGDATTGVVIATVVDEAAVVAVSCLESDHGVSADGAAPAAAAAAPSAITPAANPYPDRANRFNVFLEPFAPIAVSLSCAHPVVGATR